MGRELPGEGTRKNDGSVAKGAKPGHEIKRTPVSASTVAASTQSRPAYNNANRKLQQQRRVATGTGSGKDFYATRSAQQRKAMRSAIGILRKSTRQQIEDLHQQRVRAFLALRAAAKFSSAPSSRKPTGLEARGLELAKRRDEATR